MLGILITWLLLETMTLALVAWFYYKATMQWSRWRERWFLAPDICGHLWCLKPPNDTCHLEKGEDNKHDAVHRYRSARLMLINDAEIIEEINR